MKEFSIQKADPKDSFELLEFLKKAGDESDNLIFGSEGLGFVSVEDNAGFIQKFLDDPMQGVWLVEKNRDGEIVGSCMCDILSRQSMLIHNYELEVAVLEKYQRKGIGTSLINKTVENIKNIPTAEKISTRSLVKNRNCTEFLEKFGFEIEATNKKTIKIGNEFFDQYVLSLFLR